MENIEKKIFELADEKYKQFHTNLCPGTNNIVGVRVPILRKYAKDLIEKYSLEEILSNLGNTYYEEVMLEGMLIGIAKLDTRERIKYIQKFVPKIDNWAVCDVTCAGLKFANKNRKIVWELLQNYLKSNKEFELRFAIVMMLDFYITDEYIKLVLQELNKINHDGYYVKMAVAWAISICFIKYPDETYKLIKNNNMDNFTHNKAIQKIIESYRVDKKVKDELKKLKR